MAEPLDDDPPSWEQVGWVDDEGPGYPPVIQPLNAPPLGYKRRRPVFVLKDIPGSIPPNPDTAMLEDVLAVGEPLGRME